MLLTSISMVLSGAPERFPLTADDLFPLDSDATSATLTYLMYLEFKRHRPLEGIPIHHEWCVPEYFYGHLTCLDRLIVNARRRYLAQPVVYQSELSCTNTTQAWPSCTFFKRIVGAILFGYFTPWGTIHDTEGPCPVPERRHARSKLLIPSSWFHATTY